MDNYKLQMEQARRTFLTYDHRALARKLYQEPVGPWLQAALFGQAYRISRETGIIEKWEGQWVPAEGFGETMTLLDLVCDSREDRFVLGRYKSLVDFGLMLHRQLLEEDPWAKWFQDRFSDFCEACRSLGGKPFPKGDGAFVFRIFEELTVVVQLWLGDEEFPPSLRILWDENALMYLRYETMHYAKGLLLQKIRKAMEKGKTCCKDEGFDVQ
jgi:hypothetical protein